MSSIAVIGAGVSGLTVAYYLSRKHTVTLLEKETRLGGHTHTVAVETSLGLRPVDTGFIVHNDRTYPNLVRLLGELGVGTQAGDMSFSVSCRRTGMEYSSRGLNGFFARRANLLRPAHYLLFREILRFNREAPAILDDPSARNTTLGEFIAAGRYSSDFTRYYLYPMASAVWSMAPHAVRGFPAQTLVRFFDNHGMLGLDTHPSWKVIRGGSSTYIPLLTAPFRERIHTGTDIVSVARRPDGVTIEVASGPARIFDQVVFACHGDQVLPMLEAASDAERDILRHFAASRNETVLHTDASLLPRRKRARASWNYNLGAADAATVTYHMNRLQSLDTPEDYCVTLNAGGKIAPLKVIRTMVYRHPLYTREAVGAQGRWAEISGHNRTHFCGAYWFYGFHEDGLNSALRVARVLGVEC